jgi:hypothetical protein
MSNAATSVPRSVGCRSNDHPLTIRRENGNTPPNGAARQSKFRSPPTNYPSFTDSRVLRVEASELL